MKLIDNISRLRELIKIEKRDDNTIAFVPTMGALHKGHLTLVKEAKKSADVIIVSIFVNPTQFGKNEDLDRYPKDLNGDSKKLEKLGVDIIFYPKVEDIYPKNYQTTVSLSKVTLGLCGDKRPGHFDGVSTIVLKLFNIVTPDIAFFGLKDYQQFRVISQMVLDLNLPIKIKGIDIIREADGLAMSSRNLNLSKTGRKKAGLINKILKSSIDYFYNHKIEFKNSSFLVDHIKNKLSIEGFIIDYVEIRDEISLENVKEIDDTSMIFIAVFIDTVRLIDNFSFRR